MKAGPLKPLTHSRSKEPTFMGFTQFPGPLLGRLHGLDSCCRSARHSGPACEHHVTPRHSSRLGEGRVFLQECGEVSGLNPTPETRRPRRAISETLQQSPTRATAPVSGFQAHLGRVSLGPLSYGCKGAATGHRGASVRALSPALAAGACVLGLWYGLQLAQQAQPARSWPGQASSQCSLDVQLQ